LIRPAAKSKKYLEIFCRFPPQFLRDEEQSTASRQIRVTMRSLISPTTSRIAHKNLPKFSLHDAEIAVRHLPLAVL
jgi:hypothetical protein